MPAINAKSYYYLTDAIAVLTIFAALWDQVEYRMRQLMPWLLMSQGETPAEDTLLLNYLTSSTLGSFFRSIRRRHFPVSIGISGSLLLRLLIIFSTGLFSLENRSIVYNKEFITLDNLDLGSCSMHENTRDPQPVSSCEYLWGARAHNLPLPHGSTSEFAVQTFQPPESGT